MVNPMKSTNQLKVNAWFTVIWLIIFYINKYITNAKAYRLLQIDKKKHSVQ